MLILYYKATVFTRNLGFILHFLIRDFISASLQND